ncbi:Uncharacterised protein [Amycolatopsis camponoti]|uniref:Uncharacterized protein n=1 Tax=Amycolatopsis camponoti TaxID=2606593 RepID=A0A6I8LE02_9PSEU|nr:hypothetical protein [Amycolatopsis camponoti]VVJ15004.1 Uncharacterised protein [Amycolatopsis camponoti]
MSTGKALAMNLTPAFAPTPSISLAPALHSLGSAAASAAPFVAGAAAAAGAVFLTRAALRGLGRVAEAEEGKLAEANKNRAETIAWDRAFAEVLIRNNRIARLRGLSTSASTPVSPPPSFVYNGQTTEEIASWCTTVDAQLLKTEQELSDARIRASLGRPVSDRARVVYQRVQRVVVSRPASGPGNRPPSGGPGSGGPRPGPGGRFPVDLRPVVDDILAGAIGRIGGDDMASLSELAAEVLAQDGVSAGKAFLDELYLQAHEARVRQERRVADAEDAAKWLAALAPLAGTPDGLSAHQRKVLAALEEVLAERRELDPGLRLAAEELQAVAVRAAEDRAIRTEFALQLKLMGYAVDEQHGTGMRVTHENWGGDHHADVDIHAGEFTADFRTTGSAGRADLRLTQWAKDASEARQRLEEAGVRCGKLYVEGLPDLPVRDIGDDEYARRQTPKFAERPLPR